MRPEPVDHCVHMGRDSRIAERGVVEHSGIPGRPDQRGEVSACRLPEGDKALRIKAIARGIGAQEAHRGLGILDRGGKARFGRESVVDRGNRDPARAQRFEKLGREHPLVALPKPAAMDVDHQREGARALRKIEIEPLARRERGIGHLGVIGRRERGRAGGKRHPHRERSGCGEQHRSPDTHGQAPQPFKRLRTDRHRRGLLLAVEVAEEVRDRGEPQADLA